MRIFYNKFVAIAMLWAVTTFVVYSLPINNGLDVDSTTYQSTNSPAVLSFNYTAK